MTPPVSRRVFVKHSLVASAGAAMAVGRAGAAAVSQAADAPAATQSAPAGSSPAVKDALPQGKIGNLKISRMLLGGNLLTHFTHSRDLQYVYALAKHYNTEEKIIETMALAEAQGINTLAIHTFGGPQSYLTKYREKHGGKMQWIICPTAAIEDGLAKFNQQVQQLVDAGTDALYIWGVQSDQLVKAGRADLIAKAVEAVKLHGVPCGVGGHLSEVLVECERLKVPNDFYIKTLHHHDYPTAKLNHDSSWCEDPEKVIETMSGVIKPWIAFKVMAAGAIPPQNAFQYAFANGADFVLAGMFDFEIEEDARIVKGVLSKVQRSRPWRA